MFIIIILVVVILLKKPTNNEELHICRDDYYFENSAKEQYITANGLNINLDKSYVNCDYEGVIFSNNKYQVKYECKYNSYKTIEYSYECKN